MCSRDRHHDNRYDESSSAGSSAVSGDNLRQLRFEDGAEVMEGRGGQPKTLTYCQGRSCELGTASSSIYRYGIPIGDRWYIDGLDTECQRDLVQVPGPPSSRTQGCGLKNWRLETCTRHGSFWL